MISFKQTNVLGKSLNLKIERELCDFGECEEYFSVVQDCRARDIGLNLLIFAIFVLVGALYISKDQFSLTHIFYITSLLVFAGALTYSIPSRVKSEKVLFVPSFGLQQTTSYLCGLQSNHFIPQSNIVDIIINEAIGWNHKFYLAVIVREDDQFRLVPLFQGTNPRLRFLMEVHSRMLHIFPLCS